MALTSKEAGGVVTATTKYEYLIPRPRTDIARLPLLTRLTRLPRSGAR